MFLRLVVFTVTAMLPSKLAFVDLETTGARNTFDRILEIGIVRVEEGEVTGTYHSLFNPLTHIPPEIQRLTGISMQDVIDAPLFSSVKEDILAMLDDCVFVAHNVRFDYGFLKSEFFRSGIQFTARHFCTVKLSQYLFPQYRHHNLDSLIERYGLECSHRHRALDDAKAIHYFYQKVQEQIPNEKLIEAVNKALKKPSLPLHLKTGDLENLPELPGVYIFSGEDGTPLYIGKSKNIRERVLSHFSADIRRSIEMKISQQIRSIETIVTAGELGALLLESRLIKEKLPLYNRRLRLKQQLTGLFMTEEADGYTHLTTETLTSLSLDDVEFSSLKTVEKRTVIGFFRSVKQAKEYLNSIAKEYSLCEKLLGLEKTSTACFGYRLERCRGACLGKERPIAYNMRLVEAIHRVRIKPWPFNGPVVIKEHNDFTGTSEQFLIDRWCLLGSITSDTTDVSKETLTSPQFDLDVYKILRQYLSVPGHLKNIAEIPEGERQKIRASYAFSL